jgi:hypothetical protein
VLSGIVADRFRHFHNVTLPIPVLAANSLICMPEFFAAPIISSIV